jgi:hypothetical protein
MLKYIPLSLLLLMEFNGNTQVETSNKKFNKADLNSYDKKLTSLHEKNTQLSSSWYIEHNSSSNLYVFAAISESETYTDLPFSTSSGTSKPKYNNSFLELNAGVTPNIDLQVAEANKTFNFSDVYTYDQKSDKFISRYPTYSPHRDNEEYFAQRQTKFNRLINSLLTIGKLLFNI